MLHVERKIEEKLYSWWIKEKREGEGERIATVDRKNTSFLRYNCILNQVSNKSPFLWGMIQGVILCSTMSYKACTCHHGMIEDAFQCVL